MTDIYGPSWQERAEAAEAEVERLTEELAATNAWLRLLGIGSKADDEPDEPDGSRMAMEAMTPSTPQEQIAALDAENTQLRNRPANAQAEVERLTAALAEIGRINSGGGDAHEMRMATIAVCREATEGEGTADASTD